MKTNYQLELDNLIEKIKDLPEKPTLLLHACCAPCSSYCLEYLIKYFRITIYYYNPNIYPQSEYERRLEELITFLPKIPEYKDAVTLIKTTYNQNDYFEAINVKEEAEMAKEPEKGERCRRCYEFRMKKAYEYALEHDFEYFCTTLSISPFKDSVKINVIGKELENTEKPKWLTSDFKKHSGFLRSLELSKEYGLYRQQYCGCIYSYNSYKEREAENATFD